jgi:adenylyltransferase/sulfurtransferase
MVGKCVTARETTMESIGSRYARQQRFAPIGNDGHRRIEDARVVIIGIGALGSVVAELLARAGVGFLRLVDRDTVEWTNLQRQSLYTESDAREGLAKVQAAATRLAEINSTIEIEPLAADVTPHNITAIVDQTDLIVDGTDNFEIRFLINDVAWHSGTPWIHGGCVGATGQVFAFRPGHTICFRCLVPDVPDPSTVATCDTAGVLGPATHLIGSLQAAEAIKTLVIPADATAPPRGGIVSVDLWAGRYRTLETENLKDSQCPCCGRGEYPLLRGGQAAREPVVLCGRDAVQIPAAVRDTPLPLDKIAASWVGLGEITRSRFLVRLHLSTSRTITLFRDGRAVIGGTDDPVAARALYARYVGS